MAERPPPPHVPMPPPPQASLEPHDAQLQPVIAEFDVHEAQMQLKPPRPTMMRRDWPGVTLSAPATKAPPPPTSGPEFALPPAAPHRYTRRSATLAGTVYVW